MKDVLKKEILKDINKTIDILRNKETKDVEGLKSLSNQAIEDVALYKDLDMVSVSVLIYSIYKIIHNLNEKDYQSLLDNLKLAHGYLQENNFRKYNTTIKSLYKTIHSCNAKVKEHLQDVMQAARIKKGAILFKKGLSIGQAAGLMGLSNWDLQQYAGHTTAFEQHSEKIAAKKRVATALTLFSIK